MQARVRRPEQNDLWSTPHRPPPLKVPHAQGKPHFALSLLQPGQSPRPEWNHKEAFEALEEMAQWEAR